MSVISAKLSAAGLLAHLAKTHDWADTKLNVFHSLLSSQEEMFDLFVGFRSCADNFAAVFAYLD